MSFQLFAENPINMRLDNALAAHLSDNVELIKFSS